MPFRIDKPTIAFMVLCVVSGVACLLLRGMEAVVEAVEVCGSLLLFVVPQITAGLLLGGMAQQLISKEKAAVMLGERSRMRGLLLATVAGLVTPGGPFTSFPLVHALWIAGADAGALVAYLASWALIGLNRILVWEVPFMGVNFSLLRLVVSLPLPIIAGLIARLIVTRTALSFRGDARQ